MYVSALAVTACVLAVQNEEAAWNVLAAFTATPENAPSVAASAIGPTTMLAAPASAASIDRAATRAAPWDPRAARTAFASSRSAGRPW